MRDFEFARARSLEEAAQLFASGGEAALIAGGHTLLPAMKSRLRAPDRLIDITAIPGLDRIERNGDRLWIGATARHAVVADDAAVRASIPSLARLALGIGDPQVRNRGTIGGSIANNDPAADYPAACLALDATVETTRAVYSADDFFLGMFTTALEEGEVIRRIGFAVPQAGAYAKFRHPASRYAMVGVYVARHAGGHRVAVTGAGPGVFRWTDAEAALDAAQPIDKLRVEASELNSDIHASADYRAHLCGVMLAQAVAGLE